MATVGPDAKENGTLLKGRWAECERKILVVMTFDASIPDVTAGANTETPEEGGFAEIWLADCTRVEPFGAVDRFAVAHLTLKGHLLRVTKTRSPMAKDHRSFLPDRSGIRL